MPKVFEANPTQGLFLQSKARFVGFFGGVGSGKSAAGSIKAIMKVLDGDGIIVGPDYPHFSRSTWPELAKWLPWSRVVNRNLNHPNTSTKVLRIQTPKGLHNIYYGGYEDASSWAGPSVNWVWADEFRRKPTRQWFDVLAGRIRVGENPQLWMTTTPKATLKGRRHWLYDVFVAQKFNQETLEAFRGADQKLVEYFTASTEENASHLDPLYLASLRGLYAGKYAQQELGGSFIQFEGQVYEEFSEDGDGSNVTEAAEYTKGIPVEWAVDDGFTAGHPRVILMAQVVPPYVNVFCEYVATFELPEKSVRNALGMSYPKPSVARVDSSAAELIQRLWDEGIDTHRGSHDVDAGIAHLRAFIRDGNGQVHLRFHPRCTFSIAEIQAYAYPDAVESGISESSLRASRPLKESDNAADALRYLVWPKQLALLEASASTGVIQVARAHAGEPGPGPGPASGLPQPVEEPLQVRSSRRHSIFSIFGGPREPRPSRPPVQRPRFW